MPEAVCENLIVLCIDNLNPAFLGCYGNSTVDTEHLDHLAAESLVFDACYAAVPECDAARRQMLTGRSLLAEPQGAALPWGQLGVRRTWVGPSDRLDRLQELFADFTEAVGVEPDEGGRTSPSSVLAAAVDWLSAHHRSGSFLLWIELDSLLAPRHVPEDWLRLYEDELAGLRRTDDRQPIRFEQLQEEGAWSGAADEEAWEGYRVIWGPLLSSQIALRYAAALTWTDDALGEFLAALRDSALWENTAIVLVSDHGERIVTRSDQVEEGTPAPCLHEEWLHVPLLVRIPGGCRLAGRSQALLELADIGPGILDLLGHSPNESTLGALVRGQTNAGRSEIVHHAPEANRWGLRTRDWLFVTQLDPRGPHEFRDEFDKEEQVLANSWLYAKPEDRWERNDLKRAEPVTCVEMFDRLVALVTGRSGAVP